jgi:Flp pilus assembly protein TadG
VSPAIRTKRHPACSRRGASAAELAIILPLLVTITLACIDFGRFAYSYIALTNAARAGASYAMMNNYSTSTFGTWVAGITAAAQQEMTGQIGYTQTNLTVSSPAATSDVIVDGATGLRRVAVTVSYPFHTMISWAFGGYFVPSSMTMQRTVVVRLIR